MRAGARQAPTPDAEFSELLRGGELAQVAEFVAGCWPGSPHLSRLELDAIRDNASIWLDTVAEDRALLTRYQAAKLTDPTLHRPVKLLFWLRDIGEVLRSARRWAASKPGGTRTGPRDIPEPADPDWPAYAVAAACRDTEDEARQYGWKTLQPEERRRILAAMEAASHKETALKMPAPAK